MADNDFKAQQQVKSEPVKENLIKVRIMRDYWPSDAVLEKELVDENGRVRAPAELSLPLAEAKRLIDLRAAERTDPLPGDA
jgi:hypothetical protein